MNLPENTEPTNNHSDKHFEESSFHKELERARAQFAKNVENETGKSFSQFLKLGLYSEKDIEYALKNTELTKTKIRALLHMSSLSEKIFLLLMEQDAMDLKFFSKLIHHPSVTELALAAIIVREYYTADMLNCLLNSKNCTDNVFRTIMSYGRMNAHNRHILEHSGRMNADNFHLYISNAHQSEETLFSLTKNKFVGEEHFELFLRHPHCSERIILEIKRKKLEIEAAREAIIAMYNEV